jgi:haloalkane dehalogenase
MRALRTPEQRFEGLAGFDLEPDYAEVPDGEGGELRMAFYDTGPSYGQTVLLLHGEPSWSYLYRTVIPALAGAGLRAVAVDLVGFGRSDKPAEVTDHTYARHIAWVRSLVLDVLGLSAITIVGQDWGGLIGLRLVAADPARFARVVAANTGLPTGDQQMPQRWLRFAESVATAQTLDVARFVQSGCRMPLSEHAQRAYDAPFPDESYKAAVRAMPLLVPRTPDDPESGPNRAAWAELVKWQKPFLVTFSDSDPITGPMAPILKAAIPGAAGREHPVITGAGHFLQEDAGPALGQAIVDFIQGN